MLHHWLSCSGSICSEDQRRGTRFHARGLDMCCLLPAQTAVPLDGPTAVHSRGDDSTTSSPHSHSHLSKPGIVGGGLPMTMSPLTWVTVCTVNMHQTVEQLGPVALLQHNTCWPIHASAVARLITSVKESLQILLIYIGEHFTKQIQVKYLPYACYIRTTPE